MASQTPANILGLGASKGSLISGKDADIVIFDSNINVSTTIVQGRVIYNKENS
jgi:N-acetylglucosamine-6-phosphate deacetylase